MRVTVPATLLVLVVTAALLLLAGAGLVVSGDQRQRAAEVARLRALGLTRRETARVLLAEHGSVLVLLVSLGVAAGAVASVAIGPGLVRSDLGVAPVPPAAVVWPWASELAVVGGLLLACVVVVRVVTAARVRRSDLAQLRTGES
jgi:predicted lysophospholipase L1 biosynthesis ABC-type transport system permease subunit